MQWGATGPDGALPVHCQFVPEIPVFRPGGRRVKPERDCCICTYSIPFQDPHSHKISVIAKAIGSHQKVPGTGNKPNNSSQSTHCFRSTEGKGVILFAVELKYQ